MTNIMTTRMSSKGQVVLPGALRDMYGWGAGTAFTVLMYKGSVIMRPLKTPSEDELAAEFDEAFNESRSQAKAAGMTPAAIGEAIADVRRSSLKRRARR